jgi:hypothetical protein
MPSHTGRGRRFQLEIGRHQVNRMRTSSIGSDVARRCLRSNERVQIRSDRPRTEPRRRSIEPANWVPSKH